MDTFNVRRSYGDYAELSISVDNTTISSGFLNPSERKDLAQRLKDAAEDLLFGLPEEPLHDN